MGIEVVAVVVAMGKAVVGDVGVVGFDGFVMVSVKM